jgi:amino acid transporter
MAHEHPADLHGEAPTALQSRLDRIKLVLFGPPRDLRDKNVFHQLSLIPFLAWVGLGADGLSSSAYGPEEAFKSLGAHSYLAVALAAMAAITVLVISAGYRGIIEAFPHGGGGYVVATKLLGRPAGVISGSALLVDYVLTITVSIAAAGDAIFSLMPLPLHVFKVPAEILFIFALIALNIRGVRESALALAPVFVVFVVSHVAMILGGIISHAPELPATAREVSNGFRGGLSAVGLGGVVLIFVHAYSLGGGTYTGIEAVSNGVPIMRDPKVQTAKRTMAYMAVSLAFTAAGLLVCYLLWRIRPVPGQTMNFVLIERLTRSVPLGRTITLITIASEGALLVVAAQAGFIDGPRVLSNMAIDSWVPRRFAALSERLTTQNGVLLMGLTSLVALLYTHGNVSQIVIMYSINVFLTFSLSMFAMLRSSLQDRKRRAHWRRKTAIFTAGFVLCATILLITVMEKFGQGGWLTLAATTVVVVVCFRIRSHYRLVNQKLADLYEEVRDLPWQDLPPIPIKDPAAQTAVVLVGSYGGLGIHTVTKVLDEFPGYFKNLIFVSVGLIDSGHFKGEAELSALETSTQDALKKYCALATDLGMPSSFRYAVGTDAVAEATKLCVRLITEFPAAKFFAGKVIFKRETWYHRLLHNETGLALQKRLYFKGATLVVLPARVT